MLKLDQNEQIDWFRVTVDFQQHGYKTRDIAKKTGIPDTTIRGWRLGFGRPRLEIGIRVLNLWCEVTGKEIHSVPTFNEFPEKRD